MLQYQNILCKKDYVTKEYWITGNYLCLKIQ
jgi:hypothetical protein